MTRSVTCHVNKELDGVVRNLRNGLAMLHLITMLTGCTTAPIRRTSDRQEVLHGSISQNTGALTTLDLPNGLGHALTRLSGNNQSVLARHLAASSRWRLTSDSGQLLAVRRGGDEGFDYRSSVPESLRASFSGFFTEYRPTRLSRVRIRFAPKLPLDYWDEPGHYQDILLASHSIKLRTWKSDNPGFITNVRLNGGNGVYVEILEESFDLNREFTKHVLHDISTELEQVIAHTKQIEAEGYLAEVAPAKSTILGPSTVSIEGERGIYNLVSYVNPGEAGYTRLRVFDLEKGRSFSPSSIDRYSREYSGWSKNSNRRFFINSQFFLNEGKHTAKLLARAEVWFVPQNGRAERKLTEATMVLSGTEN